MTIEQVVWEVPADEHADVFRESVRPVVRELMNAEVSELIGAKLGERNPEGRMTQRNGYRPRRWDARTDEIELQIPKLRHGSYFPHGLLEPRKRGERALFSLFSRRTCAASRRAGWTSWSSRSGQSLALGGEPHGGICRSKQAAAVRGRQPVAGIR
jgi:putative transposase